MHTEHGTDVDGLLSTDAAAADDGDAVMTDNAAAGRERKTEEPTASPREPRSRPDFGCLAGVALFLAMVLMFGWLIISAIVDVAKENREAELRRWQAYDTYRQSVERRSSGGSSSGGSNSGSASSGGSASYGSSGSTYKPKSKSGSEREDEYNAADFGNAEDFYDEHYDDFFDYYDAEDYWNEHN